MNGQFAPTSLLRGCLDVGPLASHIDGFSTLLASQGYARSTAREKLRLVVDLSRWLGRRKLSVADLDEQRVSQFLTNRRRRRARHGNAATCKMLLSYLRHLGRIPSSQEQFHDTPLNRAGRDFEQFLTSERGLTPATLANYLPTVRRFLTERFGTGVLRLDELSPQDINRFILRHAQRQAHQGVTASRSIKGSESMKVSNTGLACVGLGAERTACAAIRFGTGDGRQPVGAANGGE